MPSDRHRGGNGPVGLILRYRLADEEARRTPLVPTGVSSDAGPQAVYVLACPGS